MDCWFEERDTAFVVVADASTDDIVDRMLTLSVGDGAVCLRIGETLATLRAMDWRKIDYTTWGALVHEEVGVDRSLVSKHIALAKSDLFYVKAALCRGVIPITVALEAPKLVTPDEQIAWVAGVISGDIVLRKSQPRRRIDLEDPADAALVHETRKLARTVIGHPCTDEVVDRHILGAWRKKVNGRRLVREASEPRDPPPPETVDWRDDPAAEFLGPRILPVDEHEALEQLRALLALRRTRRIELGLWYEQVAERRLYSELGFDSLEEFARETFPLSQRAIQKYAEQARALSYYPELLEAFREGISLDRLLAIYDIATEENVQRWLRVASRTSMIEIERATQWAAETTGDAVLETYEAAIEQTNDAHTWVAIDAARRPERAPRRLSGVDPDLVEACRWYQANVKLPKQHGFQRVKERQRFTCQNPLCNRITLRTEAHHRRFRRDGGGDEDENALCGCTPCHRRGLHAVGVITLTRVNGVDLWTYPSGRRIIVR